MSAGQTVPNDWPPKRLAGSICVVTGATGGLGSALSYRIALRGATVILVAREETRLSLLQERIKNKGGTAYYRAADLSRKGSVIRLFRWIDETVGPVDILLNCAGEARMGRVTDLSEEDLELMLDANLRAMVYCCQEALVRMIPRGMGTIVNVLSSSARVGRAGEAGYAASKFAAAGFTESLRAEVSPLGIMVTAVVPGGMRTEFWAKADPQRDIQGFMEPGEVAARVVETIGAGTSSFMSEITISRHNVSKTEPSL